MKYIIKRTSDWWGEKQPCKDAYKDGEVKDGVQAWAINVCSLKDIDDITKETNCPVIYCFENVLEIYDAYRE
jgi:hypothetical protein